MNAFTAQDALFKHIREKLPLHITIADAVSDILHVSVDSAYRRIRGETLLVLDEATELCRHFHLSLDQLLEMKSDNVMFRNVRISNSILTYKQYLEGLQGQLKQLAGARKREVIYMSKDLPIFHNFYFRPLIGFRYFFWMKAHLLHPDFQKLKFSFEVLPADIEQLSNELTRTYAQIPSVEMWNIESINSTISQIEFSKDSGHFSSVSDVKKIYTALEESVLHMKAQAQHGVKFMPGEDYSRKPPNFRFFYNRVVLGDNTIMVTADGVRSVFINYGHLNYIMTNDEGFCNELHHDFENLIRRSTLISQSSEKQRNIFFHILLSKINDRKKNL
jgi:hypothetical protein